MSTPFQQSVWRIIQQIPAGRVSSYSDVARALGRPGAARAVGNALNMNPHAPQVPCHRIVKSDGFLGGYAGGRNKKMALLKKEGILVKNERIVDFGSIMYKFI